MHSADTKRRSHAHPTRHFDGNTCTMSLSYIQPLPRPRLRTQTDQQMTAPVTPGNTEAQPGQQAAPHGQAMDQQGQTAPSPGSTEAKPGQQGQMTAPIPPGNTEAQPGQQAAPHGQALNQQRQATHAEDAAAGEKAAGQPPAQAPSQ